MLSGLDFSLPHLLLASDTDCDLNLFTPHISQNFGICPFRILYFAS